MYNIGLVVYFFYFYAFQEGMNYEGLFKQKTSIRRGNLQFYSNDNNLEVAKIKTLIRFMMTYEPLVIFTKGIFLLCIDQ